MKNLKYTLMSFLLISALARGTFAIEPKTALGLTPFVLNFMETGNGQAFAPFTPDWINRNEEGAQNTFAVKIEAGKLKYYSCYDNLKNYTSYDQAPEGSIAVIPISGVVMKYDYCGAPGTMSIAAYLRDALSHKNIVGVVLKVDGPGGMVDGTASLADEIFYADKPIVTFVDDGMMASADYWIGSAADYIIASHKHCMIGSIGVYTTLADYTGYYEQNGVKLKEIYANKSTEKNLPWRKAMQENDESLVKIELGVIADTFISTVEKYRGDKLGGGDDPMKGKLFFSPAAKANGLIDGIGDFASAVQKATQLSKTFTINI